MARNLEQAVNDAVETVVKRDGRAPAELPAGAGNVKPAAADLTRAGRQKLGSGQRQTMLGTDITECLYEVQNRCLLATRDVDRAGQLRVGRKQIGADHV